VIEVLHCYFLALTTEIKSKTEQLTTMNYFNVIVTYAMFIQSVDAMASSGNANLKTSTTTTTKNPVSL